MRDIIPIVTIPLFPSAGCVPSTTKARAVPYTMWALLYIAAWTVLRLWFCSRLELVGDEAYYWVCSRHLALSYFDKGPGAAWTIAFGTGVFGNNVFGVRWLAVLLSAGTSVLIFMLARRLFSARVAFWTVLVCELVPLFAVGSILMTIDPISLFFWTAAALAFWTAKDGAGISWWLLTGALVGLGALGKYTNLAELVSFALFCACRCGYRHQFLRPGFYLMLVATLVCSLPMIVWNAQHDWITVHHLAHRGSLDQAWRVSVSELFGFLGGQAGVISPLLWIGLLVALFLPVPDSEKAGKSYLLALFLPLFLAYGILSLNHAAQANWPAPAYLGGLMLLVAAWLPRLQRGRLKVIAYVAIALAAIETLLLHNNTSWLRLPPGRDPLDRARGSEFMASEAVARLTEHRANFLIANNYQNASLLSFYIPGHPTTFNESATCVEDQYSIWPGYNALFQAGASAVFVSDVDHLPSAVRRDFRDTTRLAPIRVTDGDREVRSIYYFLCQGFHSEKQEK